METIYIVRHGETAMNRQGVMQGHLNIPLSDAGRKEAELVARALSSVKFDAVYSSDLDRAAETARTIMKYQSCKLILDRRLRELHCGLLQGKTLEQSRREFPEFFQEFEKEPWTTRRPGGESFADLDERVRRSIDDIVENYRGGRVCVVTHGGVIRSILNYVGKRKLDIKAPAVANCSISVIRHDSGRWEILEENKISHLSEVGEENLLKIATAYHW